MRVERMIGDSLHSMLVIVEVPVIGSTESVVGGIMTWTLVNMRDDADKIPDVLLANSWCPQFCKSVSNIISSIIQSVDPQQCVHPSNDSHLPLVPDLTDTAVD